LHADTLSSDFSLASIPSFLQHQTFPSATYRLATDQDKTEVNHA